MKNVIALIIGLILTLGLLMISFELPFLQPDPTSASTEPTDTNPPSTESPGTSSTVTEAPTDAPVTEPVILDLPMTAIVLTEQYELSRDENGVVNFTYIYPNIRLYLNDESIGETVTLDLLNRIDATRSRANSVREDAVQSGTTSGFYQVQYVPQRIDTAILSLSGTVTSFSGGAHPGSTCTGATYDLLTGRFLTLDDILTDKCTADVLCRMVVDALNSINQNGLLYSDFSISVEERFSGNFLADDAWHFSREGLCFSFEPYEVGPYSSGIITAVIPYDLLSGFLDDAWFPMEQINAQGNLIIEELSGASLDPYTSLAELNLDPNADALVIHTDGLVYDITIQTVYPAATVLFSADHLTPGSAIILRGGTGNLQILYTANGETYSLPLHVA